MTGLVLLVVGPPQHGVVTVARNLADDLAVHTADREPPQPAPVVIAVPQIADLTAQSTRPSATDVVHVHFTDQLFGPNCDGAATAYETLARNWIEPAGSTLSVTLHDLPDPADEPARYRRRRAAFARIVDATNGPVIVSSRHEQVLLQAIAPRRESVVIPLAIASPTAPPGRPDIDDDDTNDQDETDDDVAILGFIYPGKGHATALDAMAVLPAGTGLLALGRTADGHQALTAELGERAAAGNRRFEVTGYLSDAELDRRLRRARIPLAAHDRISASGSIGTWLAAGRRPLVPDGPYTRELDERCPGALTRYPPTADGLRPALLRAATDPGSTWLDHDVVLTPTRATVARDYYDALTGVPAPRARATP